MDKIKPVDYTEKLCFKCLKDSDVIHKYKISYRGYGSGFDGENVILQLCNECNINDLNKWFNEQPELIEDYCEEYKYEDNIFEFIKTLPIQGQELFENQCVDGWNSEKIDSQDWIDIKLKIAPDDIYKKYNMYSPSETKAYEERFPTCKNVYLKKYSDGSSYTKCNFGAFGESDGSCDINVSDKCYYCKNYEKKNWDYVMDIDKDITISPKEIKIIPMKEWTCKICGNINHDYSYEEYLYCNKCNKEHILLDSEFGELEYVED